MDPTLGSLIAILLGGGSVLGLGIKEFTKFRSGRAQEEREEGRTLAARVALADRRADWESAARRIIAEVAGTERRKLSEAGVALEPWPRLEEQLGPRP